MCFAHAEWLVAGPQRMRQPYPRPPHLGHLRPPEQLATQARLSPLSL